ncbi:MAG: isocitrate lyase/PEP mutase family protein [Alphaproteobacteria bacterium]|nr:isocitrate lyase/PEP mutase family protein [Alphaproteobacteria bacterium]
MPTPQARFRALIAGEQPLLAPLVLNPLMARLAENAGHRALYLGGGAMGYLTCFTEANLSLTEMAQHAVDIRAACDLPLILDGAAGWGDPMHMLRTIGMAEAAGFCAIEIEDQILPKRAHHHVGLEHIVELDLMVAKVAEAVRVRRDPDFTIIARTNAVRTHSIDEALRRGEAMKRAGADMLFLLARRPEDVRRVAERLDPPFMYMLSGGGFAQLTIPLPDLMRMGYRLFVDPVTPLLAMHRVLRRSYAALAALEPDPMIGAGAHDEQEAMHESIGLETLLAIERRTVER